MIRSFPSQAGFMSFGSPTVLDRYNASTTNRTSAAKVLVGPCKPCVKWFFGPGTTGQFAIADQPVSFKTTKATTRFSQHTIMPP